MARHNARGLPRLRRRLLAFLARALRPIHLWLLSGCGTLAHQPGLRPGHRHRRVNTTAAGAPAHCRRDGVSSALAHCCGRADAWRGPRSCGHRHDTMGRLQPDIVHGRDRHRGCPSARHPARDRAHVAAAGHSRPGDRLDRVLARDADAAGAVRRSIDVSVIHAGGR